MSGGLRERAEALRLGALLTTASQLLLDLGAQDSSRALDRRLRHYCRPGLLVIDEVGYLSYDARNADLLFQIVGRRYEQKSLVLPSAEPSAQGAEPLPVRLGARSKFPRFLVIANTLPRGCQRAGTRRGNHPGPACLADRCLHRRRLYNTSAPCPHQHEAPSCYSCYAMFGRRYLGLDCAVTRVGRSGWRFKGDPDMTSPSDLHHAGAPSATEHEPIRAPLVGWLVGTNSAGAPLVDFEGNPAGPCLARRTIPLEPDTIQRAVEMRQGVLLSFERGNPRLPLITGLIHSDTPRLDAMLEGPKANAEQAPADKLNPGPTPMEAHVDGKRVVIEGADEVVLKCGQASITLRRNGKLILKGTYLETHSIGVNRIKGGSVQVN